MEKHESTQKQLQSANEDLETFKQEKQTLMNEIETFKGQDLDKDKLVSLQSENDVLSRELKSKCDEASNMESTLKTIEIELEKQTKACEKLELEYASASEKEEGFKRELTQSQE